MFEKKLLESSNIVNLKQIFAHFTHKAHKAGHQPLERWKVRTCYLGDFQE